MVQGNCREEWVLSGSVINDLWDAGIPLREAYHRHMGKTIDFQEQELLFSDCEDENQILPLSLVNQSSLQQPLQAIPRNENWLAQRNQRNLVTGNRHKSKPDANLIAVGNLQKLEERMEDVKSSIRNHDLST